MKDTQATARRALAMMDLTLLSDNCGEQAIDQLCANANTAAGYVAAVCITPDYVGYAKQALKDSGSGHVRVATVANFPAGAVDLVGTVDSTMQAVAQGADEVDVVLPWRALMAGDSLVAEEMVRACARVCADGVTLKVIIESGQLAAPAFVRHATEICVEAGAGFVKTSTGTTAVGATPEAVRVIAEVLQQSGSSCGIKVSGGVRTVSQAKDYINLVEQVMGTAWATPSTFRIGASSLLASLWAVIDAGAASDRDEI